MGGAGRLAVLLQCLCCNVTLDLGVSRCWGWLLEADGFACSVMMEVGLPELVADLSDSIMADFIVLDIVAVGVDHSHIWDCGRSLLDKINEKYRGKPLFLCNGWPIHLGVRSVRAHILLRLPSWYSQLSHRSWTCHDYVCCRAVHSCGA